MHVDQELHVLLIIMRNHKKVKRNIKNENKTEIVTFYPQKAMKQLQR